MHSKQLADLDVIYQNISLLKHFKSTKSEILQIDHAMTEFKESQYITDELNYIDRCVAKIHEELQYKSNSYLSLAICKVRW